MLGAAFFNVHCLCAWIINIEMKEGKSLIDWEDTAEIDRCIHTHTS